MFTGHPGRSSGPQPTQQRYQCYALTFWFGSQVTNLLPSAQCAFLPAAAPARVPYAASRVSTLNFYLLTGTAGTDTYYQFALSRC